ncbi:putative cytoplasmic protein [Acidovorax phage ACPWH]|nr:putative cytoplasmic protein [Acidovorax phage ACPWH]QXV72279.1 hypothetical protein Acf1_00082 [Acidovorax phage ACF1]
MTEYQLSGENFVYRFNNGIRITIPVTDSVSAPNTNPDYLAYKEWLAAGNTPLPFQPTPEELAEIRDRAFDELREVRAPMLNAVTGIMTAALADGETALVEEGAQIRQKLLDVTQDPALNAATTYEAMKAAGQLAYRKIARGASAHFAAVFRETTGA